MKFIVTLGLSALTFAANACASPDFELDAKSASKVFEDGSRAEVECGERACKLFMRLHGDKKREVDTSAFPDVEVRPEILSLTRLSAQHGAFSVTVGQRCRESAKAPPLFECYADLVVKDGKVIKRVFRRRTFTDEWSAP